MTKCNQYKSLKLEFIEGDYCCEVCGCKADGVTEAFKLQILNFKTMLCEDCLRELHLLTLI